jgi:putative ABC transport system substrate-binding protein
MQLDQLKRREFITLLVGAAAAWPMVARAQQPANKVYRIGYLGLASAAAQATRMTALRQGLAALGYIEGKNIVIQELRLAGPLDQLAGLAAQLVDVKLDVIVTHGPGILAAKHATTRIPIVIAQTGDAVATGLVASKLLHAATCRGSRSRSPQSLRNSEGRKACQPSSRAADKISHRREPEDGESNPSKFRPRFCCAPTR